MGFLLRCHACGQAFSAAPSAAGRQVACPHCQQPNTVPLPTATPVGAAPAAAEAPSLPIVTDRESRTTVSRRGSRRSARRRGAPIAWIALAGLAIAAIALGLAIGGRSKDGPQAASAPAQTLAPSDAKPSASSTALDTTERLDLASSQTAAAPWAATPASAHQAADDGVSDHDMFLAAPAMAEDAPAEDRVVSVGAPASDEFVAAPAVSPLQSPPVVAASAASPEAPRPDEASASAQGEFRSAIQAIYASGKLFKSVGYPEVRKAFARRFEATHEPAMRRAWGDDYEAMTAWLNERPAIKEELFTAISPDDDAAAALAIFNTLRKEFPHRLESYANLAIATAVVWDQPRSGVYDYAQHAARAKAALPGESVDAIGNFRALVESEQVMQGRAQFLPWEFLVHVVNHKTPLNERQWALANYLPKRSMIGRCYDEVPYDTLMLDTGSAQARLNGQSYVLPSLVQYGGVCAMQADFSSRVAKSLGVPAEYVRGPSSFGDHHAWVMWVEVKAVARGSIAFSLESHGRYRTDKFYVGELTNPQTGKEMTDRQLELRLHLVGNSATATRHADMAMESLELLRERMSLEDQIKAVRDALALCPGHEGPWRALAAMSRRGQFERRHTRQLISTVDGLFRVYAAFPDFTWEVFDDLISFQSDPGQQVKYYERLTALYEQAGRPDLASEARLKLTDLLVSQQRAGEAIVGLAYTSKRFADDGRFVPKLLDRLEDVCQRVDGAQQELSNFYRDFLPAVPQTRGNRASRHCIAMYERGIERFRQAGQMQLAAHYEAQLARLRGAANP